MSHRGSHETLAVGDGVAAPLYVIPFDKHGACTGPDTLAETIAAAAEATDVFLFSHGWNNDWETATKRYRDFIASYAEEQHRRWGPPPRNYRPLAVGVFWPSTALVAPWEREPEIAGTGEPAALAGLRTIANELASDGAHRLQTLSGRGALDRTEAEELASILAPILGGGDDELEAAGRETSPDELLSLWRELPADDGQESGSSESGFISGSPGEGGFIGEDPFAPPAPAGLSFLDPRQPIRLATVRLMKDRAGRVGATGVASMLRQLLVASPDSRVHLVGHSYGGKVVLSALCAVRPPRPVDSVLLLQPAMSCLCFAVDADGKGRPGGYRAALERSRQPIMTTFSSHDFPLTRVFHLAVRRKSDLGEAGIAGAPPSRFAALGGFGPQGVRDDVVTVEARLPPDRYTLDGLDKKRIVAVQADAVIHGHGDIVNPATAWALLCQVMD